MCACVEVLTDQYPYSFIRPTQKKKFSTEGEQKDFRTVLNRHVDTRQRPVIMKELRDVYAKESESAVLECRVAAIPLPEIKWFHGKKEIKVGIYIGL